MSLEKELANVTRTLDRLSDSLQRREKLQAMIKDYMRVRNSLVKGSSERKYINGVIDGLLLAAEAL